MATNPSKRQDPQANRPVIEWLLDSDPSIRWQVLQDLTGASADEVTAERARVAAEGAGAAALFLEQDDVVGAEEALQAFLLSFDLLFQLADLLGNRAECDIGFLLADAFAEGLVLLHQGIREFPDRVRRFADHFDLDDRRLGEIGDRNLERPVLLGSVVGEQGRPARVGGQDVGECPVKKGRTVEELDLGANEAAELFAIELALFQVQFP